MSNLKPILFSSPMVQAILDGRKTMMRRIVKPQPPFFATIQMFGEKPTPFYCANGCQTEIKLRYQPGDILRVRETWRIGAWDHFRRSIAVDYKADGFIRREWLFIPDEKVFDKYVRQSSIQARDSGILPTEDGRFEWKPGESPCRWRPSIFMPKAAARIFLKVTGVGAERLQEMTGRDMVEEGVARFPCDKKLDERYYFIELWDSLNDKRGYGWDTNPWVWVYRFERCEKPQDAET